VGHALEAISGYGIPHGRALAAGMAVEANLGTALGFTAPGVHRAIVAALDAFGLPTSVGAAPRDELLSAMQYDKKARGGTVKFAFLKEIGQAARSGTGEWTFTAPREAVIAALAV
jgi:3-dehydroquinate synthase